MPELTLTLFNILIISGLVLIALELLIGIATGFDLVLLGSILILGGLVGNITGDVNFTLATLAALGFIYIFFGRQFVKSKLIILTHNTNIDKLIGKTGRVLQKITPDNAGMVKIEDEPWRASAPETIEKDERVVVKSIEGVTIIVAKIK